MKVIKIDLSTIKFDAYGKVEQPTLVLKKLHGDTIGTLGLYFNLKMELKFNEYSQVTFDYPATHNGYSTPLYDKLTGNTLLQIDPYGIFILKDPKTKGNGVREVKSCTGYSLEYELSGKTLTLEDGTFKLYNVTSPTDNTTIIGRILECTRSWTIGSVSSSLYSVYRTFSAQEPKVLDFMLNTAQESYGCVFVFDTYNKTINVIDANADTDMTPIYLSYDNLVKEINVTEKDDTMFTKLYASGADGVTIRDVNPIGSNYIYNLDYYIRDRKSVV